MWLKIRQNCIGAYSHIGATQAVECHGYRFAVASEQDAPKGLRTLENVKSLWLSENCDWREQGVFTGGTCLVQRSSGR